MSRLQVIWSIVFTLVAGFGLQAFLLNKGIDTHSFTLMITVIAMTALTRLRRTDPVMHAFFQLFTGLIILVLVNFIASMVFLRFDLTAEKRHTLTSNTKELLKELEDVIYVKVYLDGDFSADFKKLRQATKEKLDIYRAWSDGKVEYEFINPSESENDAVTKEVYAQLQKEGLDYTVEEIEEGGTVGERYIWPGAIFSFGDQNIPLNLIEGKGGFSKADMINKAINDLEYNITNSIHKFTIQRQKIAIIEGHRELRDVQIADLAASLQEYYTVERVKLAGKFKSLEGFDMAIIAKPDSTFSPKDKFILDQFIMNGGRSLWMVDPTTASMDSLQAGASLALGMARPLDIEDMLFRYGIRMNNNVVMDLSCGPVPIVNNYLGNQAETKLFPWFYHPLVLPKSKHPIVRNLDAIRFQFASTLDTVGNPEVKKTILLETSKYCRIQKSPIRISLRQAKMPQKPELFNQSFLPLAVLLEGKFESIFMNNIPAGLENVPGLTPKTTSVPNKMVVIGDGDVARNGVKIQNGQPSVLQLGFDPYMRTTFANRAFLLNVVNYLMDDSGLIGIRNRELTLRQLDKTKLDAERSFWQFLNILLPLFLVAFAAFVQLYVRKHMFAREKKSISTTGLLLLRTSGTAVIMSTFYIFGYHLAGMVVPGIVGGLLSYGWWSVCGQIFIPVSDKKN